MDGTIFSPLKEVRVNAIAPIWRDLEISTAHIQATQVIPS
jgi:hypothetical protein